MGQSDDIVSIKQWDIYILLDPYYNGAPEPDAKTLRVSIESGNRA